jgi:Extensin-like protein C-terminus
MSKLPARGFLIAIVPEICRVKAFVFLATLLCATGTVAAQDATVPPACGRFRRRRPDTLWLDPLRDMNIAKDWREALRTSACARFTTVLGPGADSYHDEHIHIDLAERGGGYRLCQWDVREPIAQAEKTDQKSTRIAAKIVEPVPLQRRSAANHIARPHRGAV